MGRRVDDDGVPIKYLEPPSPDEVQQTTVSDKAWNELVDQLDRRYGTREYVPPLNREYLRETVDAYISAKTQELLAKLSK